MPRENLTEVFILLQKYFHVCFGKKKSNLNLSFYAVQQLRLESRKHFKTFMKIKHKKLKGTQ
jgi:hypothetical protein